MVPILETTLGKPELQTGRNHNSSKLKTGKRLDA